MSFAQGAPTQPLVLQGSNVFLYGSSTSGNAFTVQQLGAGNVASFQTSTSSTSLIINPSGNVGIGKTNPGYALDVTGDINFTGTFRQNGAAYIGSQWTGTTSLYFVGNVGIGTTNPQYRLHVMNPGPLSNIIVETDTNAIGQRSEIRFGIPAFSGTAKRAGVTSNTYVADGSDLQFWTNASSGTESAPRMTILPSGNVGIGITNPACALSFGSTVNNKILCLWDGNTSDPVSTGYSFYGFGVNSNYLRFQVPGSGTTPSDGFYWYSANTERMRLQASTGNLGIGTNNPSKLLHVWGGMIIGASSDSRATTVTLNAPGATTTFSANSDIGDGARIMCLQCPDLSSTTANLVSFSLQVAPTGSFGTQRTSLDLKGFRVASQSYGGFCITSPFDTAGSYDLFYADRTKAYFQQSVGIGTATPGYTLDVSGTIRGNNEIISTGAGSGQIRAISGNYGFFIRNDGTETYLLHTASGDPYGSYNANRPFRINNASALVTMGNGLSVSGGSGTYTLTVTGTIGATGDITALYSDERLKTKVGSIENALDKVCSLTAFKYTHNDIARQHGFTDDLVYVGLSAQEVQKVLPEVIKPAPFDVETEKGGGVTKSKTGENYLTIQYERIVSLLVEAVKEERVERLRLQDRLERLERLLLQDCKQ
jgi:hypothetical protein